MSSSSITPNKTSPIQSLINSSPSKKTPSEMKVYAECIKRLIWLSFVNQNITPSETTTSEKTTPPDGVLHFELTKQLPSHGPSQCTIFFTISPLEEKEKAPLLPLESVRALMDKFLPCWNHHTEHFETLPPSNIEQCKARLEAYTAQFPPPKDFDPNQHYGFIEKKDLEPHTHIFVHADFHGDLYSFIKNLKAFQIPLPFEQNQPPLLNENYKFREDFQIVLLGDYVDRGPYSLELLHLIMTLKMESPDHVTLIRGNHEYLDMNLSNNGEKDTPFQTFLWERLSNSKQVNALYNSMPLTVYMGEKRANNPQGQYKQFTHGMFELHADPSLMLDSPNPRASMLISKTPILSERIVSIIKNTTEDPAHLELQLLLMPKKNPIRNELKLQIAAQRIQALLKNQQKLRSDPDYSTYNWGDIVRDPFFQSFMGDLNTRGWQLAPKDVWHYLRLCSTKTSKVICIDKGHSHEQMDYSFRGKLVASVLPIAPNTTHPNCQDLGPDVGYLYITSSKVRDWTRTVIQRERHEEQCTIRPTRTLRELY
ncbi:MAG: metallophosphoesterase [Chlamydiota bacterium]